MFPLYTIIQWKSWASILQAEELVNKTIDDKVQTAHYAGRTVLLSKDVPVCISSSSFSSSNSLAHEQRAAGKLFIHSSAPLSLGCIPLWVREHCKLVRVMVVFWLSCALATSRTSFAMTSHNWLQLDEKWQLHNEYYIIPTVGHMALWCWSTTFCMQHGCFPCSGMWRSTNPSDYTLDNCLWLVTSTLKVRAPNSRWFLIPVTCIFLQPV